jgi:hypothetical protein
MPYWYRGLRGKGNRGGNGGKMLRFGDSANFSRTLAAICLVTGPLLLAVSALIDPAWSDDSETYFSEVAANSGVHAVSGTISTVGTVIFIVGMLGVLHLLRRRSVSLGQIAAGLVVFGLIGLAPGMAFYGIDIALAQADNREVAVGIYDSEPPILVAYWMTFFFGGIVLGFVLLAVALFRRRIVPIWSPALLMVALGLTFLVQGAILNALAYVVLALAVLPLAMRIWNVSDDQWRQWELPLERAGREDTPGSVSATS